MFRRQPLVFWTYLGPSPVTKTTEQVEDYEKERNWRKNPDDRQTFYFHEEGEDGIDMSNQRNVPNSNTDIVIDGKKCCINQSQQNTHPRCTKDSNKLSLQIDLENLPGENRDTSSRQSRNSVTTWEGPTEDIADTKTILIPHSKESNERFTTNTNKRIIRCGITTLTFLVLVSLIQTTVSFLLVYKAEKNCSHVQTARLTLAVIHVLVTTIIVTVAIMKQSRHYYARFRRTVLPIKATAVCLVVLFLAYLGVIGYVEAYSGRNDCYLNKILLKAEAILTVVQIMLYIIMGNL